VHSATIGEKAKYPDVYEKGYPKGKSYGISYKSLLPKKTTNILVSGRCIGAERHMLGSLRVMPGCFITGMAAGVAAAITLKNGATLRTVNVTDIQCELVRQGAFLPNCK
jgi:hypothetical protein